MGCCLSSHLIIIWMPRGNPSLEKKAHAAKLALYKAIARSCAPLKAFDHSALFASDPSTFGHPNTALRKTTQDAVYYLRKSTPERAQAAIEKFIAMNKTGNNDLWGGASDFPPVAADANQISNNNKNDEEDLAQGLGILSIGGDACAKQSVSPLSVCGAHPGSSVAARSTPADAFRQAQSPVALFLASPPAPVQIIHETLTSGSGLGTLESPWVILVDTEHPERNREFDITFVESIKLDMKLRKGFHIRRSVTPLNQNEWEAWIPLNLPDGLTAALGRCVMIKGPSRDYWLREEKHYHCVVFCKATEVAHGATQMEIENDPTGARAWHHWLLVFPPGIQLDNKIFSSDKSKIQKKKIAMKETAGTRVILGMGLYWLVATKFGRDFGKAQDAPVNYDDQYNW